MPRDALVYGETRYFCTACNLEHGVETPAIIYVEHRPWAVQRGTHDAPESRYPHPEPPVQ